MEYAKFNPRENRLRLLSEVVSGVVYLHELGIVHGDLKGVYYMSELSTVSADFQKAVLSGSCSPG